MKLPLQETGHRALLEELAEWEGYVFCSTFLLDVSLLPLEDALLDEAASLQPPGVRSLDALHLATALSVHDEIGAFFTYDDRLAEAATGYGLPVVQPA